MEIVRRSNESEKDYTNRRSYVYRVVDGRYDFVRKMLQRKSSCMKPISQYRMNEIEQYWKKMFGDYCTMSKLIDTRWYEFYNNICEDESMLIKYIPDDFFYAFVDEYLTTPLRSSAVDDKNLYDLFFHDVRKPRTIFRRVNDIYLDDEYNVISERKAIKLCKCESEVVLKVAWSSFGGHGVRFWSNERDGVEKLKDYLHEDELYYKGVRPVKELVCESSIEQHECLSSINDSSVNSIRVITLITKEGDFVPLSSILRMGHHGSRVDNASSGGIFCGIDEDGVLKNIAFDGTGKRYNVHPNGTNFSGVRIVGYEKCLELAKKLAYRVISSTRLVSWDFAIESDGDPTLIEMNVSFGEIDFHQMCNGPLLGKLQDEILDEVFKNSFTLKSVLGRF